MARLSTSTWSLHRALGPVYWAAPENPDPTPEQRYGAGTVTLLEVPARLASMGIHTLEVCHFHLPTRDAGYLGELRAALADAGVELYSLLIDDGDLTDPQHGAREQAWVADWLAVAGALGARTARLTAGKTLDDGAVARSREALAALAQVASDHGVRATTENWHNVLHNADNVLAVLEPLAGKVGFCADFGNFKGPGKYDELARVMHLAETCHAKCSFSTPFIPDRVDYDRCLAIARDAGFDGPYVLIYDGPDDDEWAGITLEAEIIRVAGLLDGGNA